MFRFPNTFNDLPIRSLQTGRQIGKLGLMIINPDNLNVEAFLCKQRITNQGLYLFTSDIREFSSAGVIVDSQDNLMASEDLVRLQKLVDINFELVGKKVITQHKRKVGKVINFTLDDISYKIEKIYVQPSLFKGFTGGDKIIDRKQILNVTDTTITVKDVDIKAKESTKEPRFNAVAN